jgi:hypothetical protein
LGILSSKSYYPLLTLNKQTITDPVTGKTFHTHKKLIEFVKKSLKNVYYSELNLSHLKAAMNVWDFKKSERILLTKWLFKTMVMYNINPLIGGFL